MSLETGQTGVRAGIWRPTSCRGCGDASPSVPALAWLNASLEEMSLGHAVLRLPYREQITNGSGTIHGGVLATLADTAVAFALSTNFDGKMGFATADLTIHLPAPRAHRRLGEGPDFQERTRVNVGEVSMTDADGREVARALTSFLLTTSSFDYAPEGKP